MITIRDSFKIRDIPKFSLYMKHSVSDKQA